MTERQPPYYLQAGKGPQATPAGYEDLLVGRRVAQEFLANVSTIQYSGFGLPMQSPDGSVTNPSRSWVNDQFSGTFRIGVNSFGESVNKTQVWQWDATKISYASNYRTYWGTSSSIFPGTQDYLAILYNQNEALRVTLRNLSAGGGAHSTFACMADGGNDCSFGIMNSGFGGDPILAALDGFIGISDPSGVYAGNRTMWVYNRFGGTSSIKFAVNNAYVGSWSSNGVLLVNIGAVAGTEKLRVGGSIFIDSGGTFGSSVSITGNLTASVRALLGSSSRTISGGAGQAYLAAASQCQFFFDVNDQAGDSKLWDLNPTGTTMQYRVINDANTIATNYMEVSRTGTTVNYVGFMSSPVRMAAGSNGQYLSIEQVNELTTIAAAATTDTVIQIPVNAIVFAVQSRVTAAIPTAVTFTVTGTTSATQFDVAGGVSTAANTTDLGTRAGAYPNGAAQTIRITPNAIPAANTGRVRVTILYLKSVAPTS